MKKVLAMALALVMILALAACGQQAAPAAAPAEAPAAEAPAAEAPVAEAPAAEAPADEELEIWFVTPLSAHPVWNVCQEGYEQAAKDLGFKANYVGPQTIDTVEMTNQIEIALSQGVDGICTMPISPEAMRSTFVKCDEVGTPYVFSAADDQESHAIASVGTNEKVLGNMGAEKILEKFNGEPINAMIMMSTLDASFAINSRDGYLEVLEAADNFNLVSVDFCNSDTQTAMDKFSAALMANPEINCIIGVCSEAGPAAARVCQELNVTDKVTIMAIDDIEETLDMVRSGLIWGTMAQNFYQIGYKSAVIMYNYLKDGTMPETYVVDSGCCFVNNDNIDTYADSLK